MEESYPLLGHPLAPCTDSPPAPDDETLELQRQTLPEFPTNATAPPAPIVTSVPALSSSWTTPTPPASVSASAVPVSGTNGPGPGTGATPTRPLSHPLAGMSPHMLPTVVTGSPAFSFRQGGGGGWNDGSVASQTSGNAAAPTTAATQAPVTRTSSSPSLSAAANSPSHHHMRILRYAAAALLATSGKKGRRDAELNELHAALGGDTPSAGERRTPIDAGLGMTSTDEDDGSDDSEEEQTVLDPDIYPRRLRSSPRDELRAARERWADAEADEAESSSDEEAAMDALDEGWDTPAVAASRTPSSDRSKEGSPLRGVRRLVARKRFPSYGHIFVHAEPTLPISQHGLIGNLSTAALISDIGTVVWMCYPHFDSPTIFNSLMDEEKGGRFSVKVAKEEGMNINNPTNTKQLYFPETNVLLTRFFSESGVGNLTDFMPMGEMADRRAARGWLVRELEVVRGKMYFQIEMIPAFDYGRATHTMDILPSGALFQCPAANLNLLLTSSRQRLWRPTPGGGVKTKVTLEEGQRVVFVLRQWEEEKERQIWQEQQRQKKLFERQKRFLQEQIARLRREEEQALKAAAAAQEPSPMTGTSPQQNATSPTDASPSQTQSPVPQLSLTTSPPVKTVTDQGTSSSSSSSAAPADGSSSLTASQRSPLSHSTAGPGAATSTTSTPGSADGGVVTPARVASEPNMLARVASNSSASNSATSSPLRIRSISAKEEQETFGLHTIKPISIKLTDKLRKRTIEYWRDWVARCEYSGRWQEMVRRSALLLKLLTYEHTGAIIQAVTFGLPSMVGVGGPDGRYASLRDGAFTVASFLKLGFRNEGAAWISWLGARCKQTQQEDGGLQRVYGVRGETELPACSLDWTGYKGNKPVRFGCPNAKGFCLDMYGAILISIYLSNKYAQPLSYEFWVYVRKMVNYVCENWQREDEGLWDQEGEQPKMKQYVVSKLMCWVCLDRGLRLAHERSFPADFSRWGRVRNQIYEAIQRDGYNEERKAFIQAFGEEPLLDATALLMPITSFISAADSRFASTLEAILRPVDRDGLTTFNLIHRYQRSRSSSGQDLPASTTSICSFWAVEVCTRAGIAHPEYISKARLLMEQMLSFSNHLGLYAECIGMRGEFLSSYPHALTHIALVRAALYLDSALRTPRPILLQNALFQQIKVDSTPGNEPRS